MTTRPGRDAPSAIGGVMPAYRASLELHQGLELLAGRVGPGSDGLDRALRERGTRILLAAAEGGARPELWRRAFQYRCAWFGTYDLHQLLDRVREGRRVHPDGMLGIDALFRMAQQALTLAAGAMAERAERQGEGRPGRRRRRG